MSQDPSMWRRGLLRLSHRLFRGLFRLRLGRTSVEPRFKIRWADKRSSAHFCGWKLAGRNALCQRATAETRNLGGVVDANSEPLKNRSAGLSLKGWWTRHYLVSE